MFDWIVILPPVVAIGIPLALDLSLSTPLLLSAIIGGGGFGDRSITFVLYLVAGLM